MLYTLKTWKTESSKPQELHNFTFERAHLLAKVWIWKGFHSKIHIISRNGKVVTELDKPTAE